MFWLYVPLIEQVVQISLVYSQLARRKRFKPSIAQPDDAIRLFHVSVIHYHQVASRVFILFNR